MAAFDKKLRNLLVKQQLLSQDDAHDALEKTTDDQDLEQVLIDGQLVDELDLICAIAQEFDLPPINLNNIQFDSEISENIPQDLAKFYQVIPISKIGDIITLATANPFNILSLDDLKIVTGCQLRPVVCSQRMIKAYLDQAYAAESNLDMDEILADSDSEFDLKTTDIEDEFDDMDLTNLDDDESPVVKLVNMIIAEAVRSKVSDIHVEAREKYSLVRYRVDGSCQEKLTPPKKIHSALVSRVKIMAELDIAERFKPQDGKFQIRIDNRNVDFRISILPTVHGEKVVMRILDASNLQLSLENLGFEDICLTNFQEAINKPWGMVLVTGPTGSGKSTTLYSAIKEVMNPEDNIVTVEDPVEYQLEGVNQVPVNVKRGLTFAAALRSILRQDPDTVMIGEIRDSETVDIAIKAALTGHLVFSTLHTNDAFETISRLVDMGVDRFMVASAVQLVAAQRLGRRLCTSCREEDEIPDERLLDIGFRKEELPLIKENKIYRPKGCPRCNKGYKGRYALLETLPVDDDIRRLIIEGRSGLDIKKAALEKDVITLRRAGLANVLRGVTSIEDVLAVTQPD